MLEVIDCLAKNRLYFPRMGLTLAEKKAKWQGKKAILHYGNGTTEEFPMKSAEHYASVKRFVDMKRKKKTI